VKAFAPLKLSKAFAWSDIIQGLGANCDMHSHGGWITEAPQTLASTATTPDIGARRRKCPSAALTPPELGPPYFCF
jgi:hypothetical protein